MKAMYVVGGLLMLLLLGYPYGLLVVASQQEGAIKVAGLLLASVFIIALLLVPLLGALGLLRMPRPRFMGGRASRPMMRGMAGCVSGMMSENDEAVEEFVRVVKANPELHEKLKQTLL